MKSPLEVIPGVGKSIAADLNNIGIYKVEQLIGQDAEILYDHSNKYANIIQDRCLLYVFRCAIYFATTKPHERDPEKLKRRYWKD